MPTTTRKLIKYYGGAYCRFNSNHDGDTFRCDIDALPIIIGRNIPVRIANINCPEMNKGTPESQMLATRAKNFTYDALSKAKQIRLSGMQRGKYFRIVANVCVDGEDLGELLVINQLAVRVADGTESKTFNDLQEATK